MENSHLLLSPLVGQLQKVSRPNQLEITPNVRKLLPKQITSSTNDALSRLTNITPESPSVSTPNSSKSSPYLSCPNRCGVTCSRSDNLRRHIQKCKKSNDLPEDPAMKAVLAENVILKSKLADVQALLVCNHNDGIKENKAKRKENQRLYDESLPDRTKRRRRHLLMDSVAIQAGNGECSNKLMWDTLRTNKGSMEFLKKELPKDPKCIEIINSTLRLKRDSALYCRENQWRTAKVMYWGMKKMSKREFQMHKTAVELQVGGQDMVAPLVNYKAAMRFLRREIAHIRCELSCVRDLLEPAVLERTRFLGKGTYRPLESVAIRSATKLLIAVNQSSSLITFNWCGDENVFHLAVGMDEFPYFGSAISTYLLKFLDIGSQSHSPEQMGLLMATSFKEGSDACATYWRHLAAEMKALVTREEPFAAQMPDGTVVSYRFKFVGVTGDQKAHMEGAGGTSCAARHPSPYANVDKSKEKDNRMKIGGKIGVDWKVFSFEERVGQAKELEKRIVTHKSKNKGKEPSDTVSKYLFVRLPNMLLT